MFIVLADWVASPLHARGWGQPVLGFLNGLSRVLQFPGLVMAQATGIRVGHHTSGVAWVAVVAFSLPIYFVVVACIRRLMSWTPGVRAPNEATPRKGVSSAPSHSRRQFLRVGKGLAVGGAAAGFGYS